MIVARSFDPTSEKDVADVLAIVGDAGMPRLNRDACHLAYLDGKLLGILMGRSIVFVHTLVVTNSSPVSRSVVQALINYGFGTLRHLGHQEALFLVAKDNEAMKRAVEEIPGIVGEDPGLVYHAEVK